MSELRGGELAQFRQSLANRRIRLAKPLLEQAEAARWVRGSAQQARLLARAERAWREAVPDPWRSQTSIAGIHEGALSIIVKDQAMAERVRREGPRLVRLLRVSTPQIQTLRVTIEVTEAAE